jgi:hypothetical protein
VAIHNSRTLLFEVYEAEVHSNFHKKFRLKFIKQFKSLKGYIQYTDQEMIPARNARNVVTLTEVMLVTIQRENILPSKITD